MKQTSQEISSNMTSVSDNLQFPLEDKYELKQLNYFHNLVIMFSTLKQSTNPYLYNINNYNQNLKCLYTKF